MSDKFDKILSDKINDAVEHHKIPYNPKHWEQLKAKKNKKKRFVIWYWRGAAVLVLLISSSLFINNFMNSNSNKENEFENNVNKENFIPETTKDSIQNPQEKLITETVDSLNIETKEESIILNKTYKQHQQVKRPKNIAYNSTIEKDLTPNLAINSEPSNKNLEITDLKDKVEQNLIDKKKDSLVSNKSLKNKKTDSLLKQLNQLENTAIDLEKNIDKRLKLGILISSLYNVHESNASNDMGISSGLSLEIPISNKFELFVGAVYSNQSFNIINQTNNASGIVSAKGNNVVLKSRANSISSVEIPLNLKYNFKFNKRKLFVSGGISSIQYFNEQIQNTFVINERNKTTGKDNLGNSFVQYELNQTENSIDSSIDSNNFELLGSLNISAGILLPISGNDQNIIIEPYFKYSLSSITSQNVNYSNVGVQFRYNFSFKK